MPPAMREATFGLTLVVDTGDVWGGHVEEGGRGLVVWLFKGTPQSLPLVPKGVLFCSDVPIENDYGLGLAKNTL